MTRKEMTREQLLEELAALREREQQYGRLVELSPDPIVVLQDNRYRLVNPAFITLFGYTQQDVDDGLSFFELVQEQDRAAVRQRYQDRLAGKPVPQTYRIDLLARDGRVIPCETSASRITFDSRPADLVLIRDVTERRQAQQTLRETEQRYRLLIDTMNEGLAVRDNDHIVRFVNNRFCEMIGYSREDLIGQRVPDFLNEDDASYFEGLEPRRKRGDLEPYELTVTRKDGQIIILMVSPRVLYDSEGKVSGSFAVMTDITERNQVEEALRRSEQNLREAQQIAHLGSWERDIATGEEQWSDEMYRLYGYEPGEIEPTFDTFAHAVHPDDQERVFAAIEDVLDGKSPYDFEFRIVRPDGSVRFVHAQAEVFRHDGDQPVRLVGTALNITERKQAEEALEQRNRELTLLNRIIAATTSTLKVEKILEIACRELGQALQASSAGAAMLNPEDSSLVVTAEWAAESKIDTLGTRLSAAGSQAIEYMRDHKKPFAIDDAQRDARMAPFHTYLKELDLTSMLILPLTVHDEMVGVIGLGETSAREFTKREVDLATSVAAAVSQALNNARLFEAESDQRALAEALRDTSAVLNSTLDADDVLDRILQNVGQVVSHDAVDIMLIDGDSARIVHSQGYERMQPDMGLSGVSFSVSATPTLHQMVQTKKPKAIPDVRASSDWVDHPQTPGWIRSYVGAPINLKEVGVKGFINLNSKQPGLYSPVHARRLQAFADQAAIAVSNVELYKQVQLHAAQLEALHKVTLDITAELDLETLLQALVESANTLLGVSAGGIYLYRPEHDALELAVAVGEGHASLGSHLKRGEGLSGKILESGEPLTVKNYREWEGRATIFDEHQWTAVLGVPIQWGDEFLGVINVLVDVSNRTFNEHDAYMLSLFASQAAVAIKNARLYDSIHQHAARLEALRKVTLDISAQLAPDKLLQVIVEHVNALLKVKTSGMYIYRPQEDVLEWAVSTGEGQPPLGCRLKLGEGLSGRVWQSRKPITVDDYEHWEGRAAIYEGYGWGATIAVPIEWGDEFLGTVSAAASSPERTFSEDEVHLLSLLASQAAIAINNARLYEEIHQHAEELENRVRERTAELDHALAHLDAILNSVGDPVFVFDEEGNFQDVNRAFTEQIAIVPETAQVNISEFLPNRRLPAQLEEKVRSAIASEGVWRDELTIEAHYRPAFDAIVTITSLHDHNGGTTAFVGSIHDISPLKEAERLKTKFMRAVKHEMRTPLAGAKAAASMLLDGDAGPLRDVAREYVGIIETRVERLISIVDEIVDVMRLFSKEIKLELEPVRLSEVVSQVTDTARPQAAQKGQSIEIDLPEDMPPLMADRRQLERVLKHLIDNALIYAGEGRQIEISARNPRSHHGARASQMEFSVRDNGHGIPEHDLEHVFEPFFHVRDPNVIHDTGSGLGLYTVKALVEEHGGKVRARSEPGRGSTFTVTWPIAI